MIALPEDERPALIDQGTVISFRELGRAVEHRRKEILQLASSHQGSGVLIGTGELSIRFTVEVLAALASGRPMAILSPGWSASEREAREKLLFLLHPDARLVLFTSGSTGKPKAVQLSAENILANLKAVRSSLEFDQVESQTLFLPLHYSFGLLGQLFPALQAGVTTRFQSRVLDLKDLLSDRATPLRGMLSGVPAHWNTLLRFLEASPNSGEVSTGRMRASEITHVVSAGSHLSPETRVRLREVFPQATLFSNYGQTELSPRALSLSSRSLEFFTTGATGFPVGDFDAAISAQGELELKGPQVMLGYAGDPLGTAERLHEGWWRTGDLAKRDENGLVTVLGRMDDLFKISGERVSLVEVEDALRKLPGVGDAAIVVEPDPLHESRITAFLQYEPGAASRASKPAELRAMLRENLGASRHPTAFITVEQLPRTGSGKLARSELALLLKKVKK